MKKLLPAITTVSLLLISPASAAASRTFDLLNLLGVSGHVSQYRDTSKVVADAKYLGIRHWRGGFFLNWAGLNIIHNLVKNGITMIGLPGMHSPPASASVSDNIAHNDVIAAMGPGAIYALEGPNEPGNFPFIYQGVDTRSSWSAIAAFQRDYYAAIKADSKLAGIPVWSPSLIGEELDNYGLQFLTVPAGGGTLSAGGTVFADVANMHVYPMYGSAAQSIDPAKGDAFVKQLKGDFVSTYAHKFAGNTLSQASALPRVITEYGYGATGGTPGGRTTDIPTQGKNILNAFMNAWNEGLGAFTIYTFYEQGDGHGLLTGPGAPKASGTYLHNFTKPLVDIGATAKTFTPGSLNFSLIGLPATAKYLVFQKSNGNYEIVLWNNVTNWNFSAGMPIAISPTNVGITFGSTQGVLNVYDPITGSGPALTASNTNTVTITLKDYPIVVEAISGQR